MTHKIVFLKPYGFQLLHLEEGVGVLGHHFNILEVSRASLYHFKGVTGPRSWGPGVLAQ